MKGSRNNLIFTIAAVFILMVAAVIYNTKTLYKASVSGVYEDGENEIEMISADLENYLTQAGSTLRVVADTVDLMEKNGNPHQDIYKYLLEQTKKQSEQFDENFTSIYSYLDGEYLTGSGWIPPEDYDPESRDWYKTASEKPGEVVIVSPYVDARTGKVVVTLAKCISHENDKYNVVCLDVIVDHITKLIEQAGINGNGYGFVVNYDGFIVAHYNRSYNGKNMSEIYDNDLITNIAGTKEGRYETSIDGKKCTLFIRPVTEQWYAVIIAANKDLFRNINWQLTTYILVSVAIFFFISYFYFLAYKNEQKAAKKIEDMNIRIVTALASTIDAKDHYTSGHSRRVADYAVMIARKMGKSQEELDMIYSAGLLHDVGKIRVPEDIINKPGRLEKHEMDSIRIHPVSGYDILVGAHEDAGIIYAAKYHHERYDGNGYPNRLEGENIPEIARIIAVADAYDAMASDRSYRDALPQSVIREEIEKGRGTQFDPKMADVMLSIIDEDKNYELRQKEKEISNILVIDDEKVIITIVKHILQDMDGVNVLSAVNEEEAFLILERTEISLILLDLKMPETDGFELYMKIRKNHDMPVILMTADKSKETLDRIRELHIDDYVTKPLNEAITREAVYGLIHRSEIGV